LSARKFQKNIGARYSLLYKGTDTKEVRDRCLTRECQQSGKNQSNQTAAKLEISQLSKPRQKAAAG
jgi:hypothetical protein